MPDLWQDRGPSTDESAIGVEALIKSISSADLDPLFWRSDRSGVESAWYGHVPFAHWLIRAIAPRCVVELGVHSGVSYAAFCRAVQREGLGTQCFGIDTWTGDEFAGFYGDEVFTEFRGYHDDRFGSFSTLIRSRFDDAVETIADGSIDLLHIDGRHDYHNVRHDFETWRGKLSDRAVVLLHDVNVREAGFGVWQYWTELRRQIPGFAFVHAHGLGVLSVGTQCPEAVAALIALGNAHMAGALRERFAQLGERCVLEAQAKLLARQHAQVRLRLNVEETALLQTRSELAAVSTNLAAAEHALFQTERTRLAAQAGDQNSRLRQRARRAHRLTARQHADALAALRRLRSSWLGRTVLRLQRALSRLPHPVQHPIRRVMQRQWRALTPQLNPLRQLAMAPIIPTRENEDQHWQIICYVVGEPDTPGAYYRVHRYADACRAVSARVIVLRIDELAAQAAKGERFDVLVIWRAAWTQVLAEFVATARADGARVVFDVDDLMIDPTIVSLEIIDGIRSQNFDPAQVRHHFMQVRQTMLAADYCCAPTTELAEHMRRFGKICFTLPNGFDRETLHRGRLAVRRRWSAPADGMLRLGYAGGSRTHQRDFAVVAGALANVLRMHPHCRLVLFQSGGVSLVDLEEFDELVPFSRQIEWREMVPLPELPEELARFDINIAPLELDNPFTEAKSELKFFEAALAGVCTVASPVGPWARVIRHGENGFIATTEADWQAALTRLVAEPALRQRLAQAALNDVLWAYGPERRAQLMRRLLTEWQGGAAAADAFVAELKHRGGARAPTPRVPAGKVIFSLDNLRMAAVTVIVPVYNYAHLLSEALDSVRAQSLSPLDLIIVDDRSTDGSLETALRWARANADRFNRLVVIGNDENAGLGLTRNQAFLAAETDYVLPLDADNRLRPSCCALLLAALECTDAAFAWPTIQEFGGRTGQVGLAPYDASRFIGGNYVDAMALIAKSAWSAAGGYQQMRLGWEDYDFWCTLAEVGLHGFAVGGQPLADYRVHDSSMSAQVTDRAAVKDQVISSIEDRHPWVSVARPALSRTRLRLAAAADPASTAPANTHLEPAVEAADPPVIKEHERRGRGDRNDEKRTIQTESPRQENREP